MIKNVRVNNTLLSFLLVPPPKFHQPPSLIFPLVSSLSSHRTLLLFLLYPNIYYHHDGLNNLLSFGTLSITNQPVFLPLAPLNKLSLHPQYLLLRYLLSPSHNPSSIFFLFFGFFVIPNYKKKNPLTYRSF